MKKVKSIFDEVRLPHLTAKNRIVRSATWEAIANPDGTPSEEQIRIYRDLARGQVGTIITGFTSVTDSDHYLGTGMARLSQNRQIPGWKQLTDAVHAEGANIIVQLALGEWVTPRGTLEADDATTAELHQLIQVFAQAAKRAELAGFDGVQLHGAHFFWISRFLSPLYNHRTDEYGGSQPHRTAWMLALYRAVRQEIPNLHITMKLNCSDFRHGGLLPADAMQMATALAAAGIDSLEISGNGTSVSDIRPGENEAYFLPFAKALKQRVSTPVMLVGGLRSLEVMNKVINEDGIDMISLSRPLIREPHLIERWGQGDTAPAACVSCNLCYQTPGHRCVYHIMD